MVERTDALKAVTDVISEFFQEEQGNRITSNNISGLIAKINRTIMHLPEKKEESSEKKANSKQEDKIKKEVI